MDILLCHTYFLEQDPHERAVMKPYAPLGILYLSAFLKARGFEVEIFDSTFRSIQEFESLLEQKKPGIVGLYANLLTRSNAVQMARLAKAAGAWVIAGGPEPVNYPREYLERGVDVVVAGEAEETLAELIPHMLRDGPAEMQAIRGIHYRDAGGSILQTASRPPISDLNSLPFPDRQAIDIPRYVETWRHHHGLGSVSLITARGCPYKCRWCSHSVFGYTFRQRSPVNVADELESILETYRPDMVWYADDVFTINHRFLAGYRTELNRRNIKIPFETISREDRLNEEVIAALKEMGCFRIWLGSESGSQRVLDAMQRQTSAENTRRTAHLLHAAGIQVGMFIMLGYESEEPADIRETIRHLKASNPDVFLTTVAYPIKGTPYFDEVQSRVISAGDWESNSDRNYRVAGRRSPRFYRHATRWMVAEVKLHQWRLKGKTGFLQSLRTQLSAFAGKIGMLLTAREFERL